MFGILSNKSINYVCNTLYTTATAPRYGVQLHQWSRGRSVCGGVRLQACQRRLRSSNGNGKRRRAMGTTPAVRVSWSRTTRHFPRASLYTISAPLLIMSAVSLYNTSRGIGDYFGDNVQQQIENFRTWIHMMNMSANDSEMDFFEMDDETLQYLMYACNSQAIEFDVSEELLKFGILDVIREAVLSVFHADVESMAWFAKAKATAVRIQGWKFLRVLTRADGNPRIIDKLCSSAEFDDVLDSLFDFGDSKGQTLQELSEKMAILSQLLSNHNVAEKIHSRITTDTLQTSVALLFNVITAASNGSLQNNFEAIWERKTAVYLCSKSSESRRRLSSDQAGALLTALPHIRSSMRLLATLTDNRENCRMLVNHADDGRLAYFAVALAGELQGRAGDEVSFEAGRFLANMVRHCIQDPVGLGDERRDALARLLNRFGGGTALTRGLELGIPRLPGVSLCFNPTTTEWRHISNIFTLASVGIDGFVYASARSMISLQRQYRVTSVPTAMGLVVKTAMRASLGSALLYCVWDWGAFSSGKVLTVYESNRANFIQGLAVQLGCIASTAAILRFAPFSFGAVVLQFLHQRWKQHFNLLDVY